MHAHRRAGVAPFAGVPIQAELGRRTMTAHLRQADGGRKGPRERNGILRDLDIPIDLSVRDCPPPIAARNRAKPSWQKDRDLMAFLASL